MTENHQIVKKHQELIRSARYRLSELGIKTVSILISSISASDDEFKQYHIRLKDLKELIDSDSKNTYKYTHRLISELMSKPFQIGDEQFNWVSYAKYVKNESYITFEIHRKLKPYLLELKKNFLQYKLENILQLKSSYVIRLYELCKDRYVSETRYKKTKSVTFELKIDRMRELFQIPKSYLYKDIRVHILDKAVKQFKEKTDIKIEYKSQKIGRKVDRIIITVKENFGGSNNYMKNLQTFIDHVRKHHVDENLLFVRDKESEKRIKIISVDKNGLLYDKKDSTPIKKSDALIFWKNIYKLAKENKLKFLDNTNAKEKKIDREKEVEERYDFVASVSDLTIKSGDIVVTKSGAKIKVKACQFSIYNPEFIEIDGHVVGYVENSELDIDMKRRKAAGMSVDKYERVCDMFHVRDLEILS